MNSHGVYFHYDSQGTCLYIGKTGNLHQRTEAHKFTSAWGKKIVEIKFIECQDDDEATHLERDLVRNMKPKFNKNYKKLPTDDEFNSMYLVLGENKYYDNCLDAFGIKNDSKLALFFKVSEMHIKMVRSGIVGITKQEKSIISKRMECPIYAILGKFLDRKFVVYKLKREIEKWYIS